MILLSVVTLISARFLFRLKMVVHKNEAHYKQNLIIFYLSDNVPLFLLHLYPLAQRTIRNLFEQRNFLY